MKIAIMALLAVISPLVLEAAGSWSSHTHAGELAFAHRDYVTAERELRAALEIAEGLPVGDERLETSLENMARLAEHQMQPKEARELLQRLLELRRARLGRDSAELLEVLEPLARSCQATGDAVAAMQVLRDYLAIADTAQRVDTDGLERVLTDLVRLERFADHPETALPLQRRLVELRRSEYTADAPEVAAGMQTLAQLELMYGSVEAGEKLLQELAERRGESGEEIGPALASASASLFGAGRFAAAKAVADRALDVAGPSARDDGAMLPAHATLAGLSWMALRTPADQLAEILPGADRPDTGDVYLTLVNLLRRQESALGGTHPDVETTLGRLADLVLLAAGDDRQELALEAVRTVTDARLRLNGPGAGKTWEAQQELVRLLLDSGDLGAAEQALGELVAGMESKIGDHALELVPVLREQADVLKQMRRRKEARALTKRAKAIEKSHR